ncbi:MAG: hypothetical protein AMJ90_04265 [candidate division Zixibacteria bacterium SM23_73_2]|nr:MAG: hypothetical protein AMJ90_04265 [candidate division Zixibacteria bacterium SM23_73_2]
MGAALYKLNQYKAAVTALNMCLEINPNDIEGHSYLGLIFFNLGNLDSAEAKVNDALNVDNNQVDALSLKARIEIENQNYDSASVYFQRAISLDIGNPLLILWYSYTKYLKTEFSFDSKVAEYQEEILSIIRGLERVVTLTEKHEETNIQAYSLYFLGFFYYKSKDIFAAMEKLEQCIKINSSIESSARNVLNYIWDCQIRPPLWQWWLHHPTLSFFSKSGFVSLFILILILFWLPAMKPKFFSSYHRKKINSLIYILYLFLLCF